MDPISLQNYLLLTAQQCYLIDVDVTQQLQALQSGLGKTPDVVQLHVSAVHAHERMSFIVLKTASVCTSLMSYVQDVEIARLAMEARVRNLESAAKAERGPWGVIWLRRLLGRRP